MRVSALLSAAAAAVMAGVARAEVEFRFYEGVGCDGPEAITMKFQHDNTVVFDRQIYRTVESIQLEGASCSWETHSNMSTAQDYARPIRARADGGRLFSTCTPIFSTTGDGRNPKSLALRAIEVYDC